MSALKTIDVSGQSALSDPADAVREALGAVVAQLATSGAGPQHLTSMLWAAPNQAAFHLARRPIDLAYREVCGGFRPPIKLMRSTGAGFGISAKASVPDAADAKPIWRDYAAGALAHQYGTRHQVPDFPAVLKQWTRDGHSFRRGHRGLDIAYGPHAAAKLDLYRPANATHPPLWVFIHGGYWQALNKDQNAQFAAGMVRSGYAVANLDYGLCPDTPLPYVIAQIRTALQFLVDEASNLDLDASQLHLAGHSAGAHLAAMMVADTEAPDIASALLLSGLFDLAPLALLPMGEVLGLSEPATVARLSASTKTPRPGCRIGVALGALENDEFKRQSSDMATAWHAPAPLMVEGRNHFDLLDGLNAGELLDFALQTARG